MALTVISKCGREEGLSRVGLFVAFAVDFEQEGSQTGGYSRMLYTSVRRIDHRPKDYVSYRRPKDLDTAVPGYQMGDHVVLPSVRMLSSLVNYRKMPPRSINIGSQMFSVYDLLV